jgi:hypothetical protein
MAANYKLLYSSGVIAPWYLRKSQLPLYNLLRTKKRVVANCHRRFGKGTTVLVYAFERLITRPIIVRYGAPTQTQAYDILQILIDHIFDFCPELKPSLKNTIEFPSGGRMHIFGAKDSAELDKARGSESDIIIVDEYGFFRFKPEYLLKSVLSPQLDTTDGQLIITSTPPEDLTHPYLHELAQAETDDSLFRWDIDDSLKIGDISPDLHEKILERSGGEESDAYQREYKLALVANKSRLVVPEAQDESLYIQSWDRPSSFEWFFMCDLGLKDFFAGIWGYVNFLSNVLCVERELVVNYKSTGEIAKLLKDIEDVLAIYQCRRLGDSNDPQQLFDLSKDHDYQVSPIVKRSKMSNVGFRDSTINGLRVAIGQRRIMINKSGCPNLCMQLKYGIWNEHRTDFERTEKMGHLDAMMALAYMWDNADFDKNPYPVLSRHTTESTHFIRPDLLSQPKNELSKLFSK